MIKLWTVFTTGKSSHSGYKLLVGFSSGESSILHVEVYLLMMLKQKIQVEVVSMRKIQVEVGSMEKIQVEVYLVLMLKQKIQVEVYLLLKNIFCVLFLETTKTVEN